MTSSCELTFAASFLSCALGIVVLFRKQRSIANVCFFAGMVTFAIERLAEGLSLESTQSGRVLLWQTLALIARSFLPGIWLFFSLVYSRENYRDFLRSWRFILIGAFLVPIGVAIGFHGSLVYTFTRHGPDANLWFGFGQAARVLNQ